MKVKLGETREVAHVTENGREKDNMERKGQR